MRLRKRNSAKICTIVAVICCSFSIVQTDTSITVSTRTTSSNLPGSSKKADVAITTITAPVERAHARITKVEPNYGPVSGGTKIIIFGQGMTCPRDHQINVNLTLGSTQLPAHNCSQETDTVVCFTPPRGSQGTAEFEVHASCDDVSNNVSLWRTDNSVIFLYKPDPIVIDVFPKESILAGGITQTVIGTNLDSVANPLMWTGFDLPPVNQWQLCDEHDRNSTMLKCRTQPLNLDSSSFSPNESVRTHPESLDLNGRKVWIGFIFDGVTHFHNFTHLRMFHDPEFHNFNPETKVYVANEKNALSIGVTWPHMNFTPADVTVQVGIDKCTDVQLDDKSINCHPPTLPKSVIRYGPSDLNTLPVKVRIGHLPMTRDVGHLHYTSSEPFHVIISVMIAILAFIFVVSCSCGCCVFFGPRVGEGCKKGGRSKNGIQFRSDAPESIPDGGKNDGSGVRELGKRRGKRSSNNAPDGTQGQIECVAMQYRSDASRDPQ